MYVKDENRTFDVEMQVKDTGELPERSRYYQGVMDVDMLKSGEPYRALKESHVIFICLKDIFKQGLPHYTFENLCLQNPRIRLGDRSLKHFFVAENYDRKLQRTKTVLKNAYNRQARRQLHPETGKRQPFQ